MTVQCVVRMDNGTDAGSDETFLEVPRVGELLDLPKGEFTVRAVLHHGKGAVGGSAHPTIELSVTAGHTDRT